MNSKQSHSATSHSENSNGSLDTAKDLKRLRWKCRRGMLELDLILKAFLERSFNTLKKNEINAFELILELEDDELFGLLMGHSEALNQADQSLIKRIRQAANETP